MQSLVKAACVMGPVAVASAWAVIGASWYVNRGWFSFLEHAFSDLGGDGAKSPWLYNYGLVAVGLMAALFSACPYHLSSNRLEAFGAGLLFTAGVFLSLIGVFPAGTEPHEFVSTWFFVQADMALAALSIAAYSVSRARRALAAATASILAFPVYGLVEALAGWPSVASSEAYGIVIIDLVVLILFLEYWERITRPR